MMMVHCVVEHHASKEKLLDHSYTTMVHDQTPFSSIFSFFVFALSHSQTWQQAIYVDLETYAGEICVLACSPISLRS